MLTDFILNIGQSAGNTIAMHTASALVNSAQPTVEARPHYIRYGHSLFGPNSYQFTHLSVSVRLRTYAYEVVSFFLAITVYSFP